MKENKIRAFLDPIPQILHTGFTGLKYLFKENAPILNLNFDFRERKNIPHYQNETISAMNDINYLFRP